MYDFNKISGLLRMSKENDISVSEVVVKREKEKSEKSIREIKTEMKRKLSVMREAKEKGLNKDLKSESGLVKGEGKLLGSYLKSQQTVGGEVLNKAIANALAVSELNAWEK